MRRATSLLLVLFLIGCGSAAVPPPEPPPASPEDPSDETADPSETEDSPKPSSNEGKMTDVPGDKSSDPPPECNDKDTCNNMGVFAALGKNGDTAKALLQKACDLGNGRGCSNLANLYAKGTLLPKDSAKAVELNDKGCELEDPKSCMLVGYAYLDGIGVTKDPAQTMTYFTRGCELGHGESCKNAGVLHWDGLGVSRNYEAAVPFFEKACELRDTGGCFNMGVAYLKGQGFEKNEQKANEYFDKACKIGDKKACGVLKDLKAEKKAGVSGLPGANLNVGSMTANGMTVKDLSCNLQGMGFMGALTLVAAIAEKKKAFDKCSPKGDAVEVTWTMKGGKVTEAEAAKGASRKVDKCVAKAAKKMKTAMNGQCKAVFFVGKEKGSSAAYEKRLK